MAKKNNTTPGGLDNARQSKKELNESESTASTDDDSDTAQEPPHIESQESPSMINASDEMAKLDEGPETHSGDEVGEGISSYEEPEISSGDEVGAVIESIVLALYKLVNKGDWEGLKYYLEIHPDGLTTKISLTEETALHLAVLGGHVKIVEELVYWMRPQDLALQSKTGETALSLAAVGGDTKIAKPLVRKNHDLLGTINYCGCIPVVVAAQFCHVDMVHYLYWATQEEDLDPETSYQNQGGKLLNACIVAQIFDVALDLVQRFPALAIEAETLNKLATRHAAFASGTQLVFWKHWIYSCMPIQSPRVFNIHRDIEAHRAIPGSQENIVRQGISRLSNGLAFSALNHLYGQVWDLLKFLAPCVKHIHDLKVKHVQVHDLLGSIFSYISTLSHKEIHNEQLLPAVFDAVKHRNSEIVKQSLRAYPDIVWILDNKDEDRNIFLVAVLHREEKVFSLLHKMGPRMNLIVTSLDRNEDTILHHAAMLSPSSHLDHISGEALQMQRELQWFKKVEKVVQPTYRELLNKQGMTARALFTMKHEKMRRRGERWMRDTATSCTVVAALIATIMFTSAFTVPGGYDNKTGDPMYLDHDYFMTFIIADALSLLSSATSLLVFLGILKSRYTQDEFLFSLPCKLLLGIATLFLSIVTMMLTFATTIYMVLHDRLSWIFIPIVVFCGGPIMMFVCPQVPLIYETFASTFGPGIFPRQNKRWRWTISLDSE